MFTSEDRSKGREEGDHGFGCPGFGPGINRNDFREWEWPARPDRPGSGGGRRHHPPGPAGDPAGQDRNPGDAAQQHQSGHLPRRCRVLRPALHRDAPGDDRAGDPGARAGRRHRNRHLPGAADRPGPVGQEHVEDRTTPKNHDYAQGGCRVGQTSTEAKREVEQTRAHLGETLEALQLRARRNLDVKTQLQTNRVLQVVIGTLVLAVSGFAVFGYRARQRRSPAERLVRKLKLNELRGRLNDFRDDASAWASAQKRIVKADGKTKVKVQSKEGIARRLLISAAEAALTALAAGYARRLIGGASTPRERRHRAASKKRKISAR